jgi:hypothetical protein
LGWEYVTISPMQWHGFAMANFASIIAPFGGFFASGFKRAFKLKARGPAAQRSTQARSIHRLNRSCRTLVT